MKTLSSIIIVGSATLGVLKEVFAEPYDTITISMGNNDTRTDTFIDYE